MRCGQCGFAIKGSDLTFTLASGQFTGYAGGNSGTYHAIRFTPTTPNTATGSFISMDAIGGPIVNAAAQLMKSLVEKRISKV